MVKTIKFTNFNYKLLIMVVVLCFFLVKYNNYNNYLFLTLVENNSTIFENTENIVEDFDAILVEGTNQNINDNLVKKENHNSFFSWDTAFKALAISMVVISVVIFYKNNVLVENTVDIVENTVDIAVNAPFVLENTLPDDFGFESSDDTIGISYEVYNASDLFLNVNLYSENYLEFLNLYDQKKIFLNGPEYTQNLLIMHDHLDFIDAKINNYRDVLEGNNLKVSFLNLENPNDWAIFEDLLYLISEDISSELDKLESNHIDMNFSVDDKIEYLNYKYRSVDDLKIMVLNYHYNG